MPWVKDSTKNNDDLEMKNIGEKGKKKQHNR